MLSAISVRWFRRITSRTVPLFFAACTAALCVSCVTPAASLQRAAKEYDSGSKDKALEILDRSMDGLQDDAAAHALRGKILSSNGSDEEAASELKRAVELDPNDGESWHELALIYYRKKEYVAAEPPWAKYFALIDPKSVDDFCRLSVVKYKAGKYGEAFDAALGGLKIDPNYPDALFDAANAARTLGLAAEAIAYLDTLLKKNADDYQALFLRSLSASDANDFELAEEDGQRLAREKKDADYSAICLAYSWYQDNRDFSSAARELRIRFADNDSLDSLTGENFYGLPSDFRVFCAVELARWRIAHTGKTSGAIEILKNLTASHPDAPEAVLAKSVVARYDNNNKESLELALAAVRANPSLAYSATSNEIALRYAGLGDKQTAFNWLLNAWLSDKDATDGDLVNELLDDPAIAKANEAFGRILDMQKEANWGEVLKAADECLKSLPSLGIAYYWRGYAQHLLKNDTAARADAEKAIQSLPGYIDAYALRGYLLRSAAKYKEAEADYSLFLLGAARNKDALLQRGDLRMEYLGDFKGAFDDYGSVLALKPEASVLSDAQEKTLKAARRSGNLDYVFTEAEKLIADKKTAGTGYLERGIAFCVKGEFEKGLKDIQQANTLGTYDDEALMYEFLADAELGKMEEAILDREIVGLFEPVDRPEYWMARALIDAYRQEKQELNEDLKILLKLNPPGFSDWFKSHAESFAAWKSDEQFKALPW